MSAEASMPATRELLVVKQGAANSLHPPIVFVHGWGSDSAIWRPLAAHLAADFALCFIDLPGFGVNAHVDINELDALVACLDNALPARCHIVGWSLGGMLATRLAHRNPQRVSSLTTIACNAKFATSADWPQACEAEVFAAFMQDFKRHPELAIQRFVQLQARGDRRQKQCVRLIRAQVSAYQARYFSPWLRALDWLARIDNRQGLRNLQVPHLAIFGERDSLVPAQLGATFIAQNYCDRCHLVKGAAHVPQVSAAEEVARVISARIRSLGGAYTGNKKRVARSFSRAAQNYDCAARLQRKVARKLIAMRREYAGTICDLACGTGFCGEAMPARRGALVGLDIATGMLREAQRKTPYGDGQLVCADFENLPFRRASLDGVVSNMSVQWSENLSRLFEELRTALRENAWLLFSTLGPGTLNELQRAWQTVDRYVHVNRFETREAVRQALASAGFRIQREAQETEVLAYDEVMDLMRDLKSIGAHNVNRGIKLGLTTRHHLRSLELAYEKFRLDGKLPATYEVFYFLARAG